MSRPALTRRLAALVGEAEAYDLLQTPNAALGGRIPDDLIDAGNFLPVEILIRDMEAREASRAAFINPARSPEADPIRDHAPSVQGHGRIKRVLELLDSLDEGGITHERDS